MLDDIGSCLLVEVLFGLYSIKEFTAVTELCDEEEALLVLEELVQFEDIRVIQLL